MKYYKYSILNEEFGKKDEINKIIYLKKIQLTS